MIWPAIRLLRSTISLIVGLEAFDGLLFEMLDLAAPAFLQPLPPVELRLKRGGGLANSESFFFGRAGTLHGGGASGGRSDEVPGLPPPAGPGDRLRRRVCMKGLAPSRTLWNRGERGERIPHK